MQVFPIMLKDVISKGENSAPGSKNAIYMPAVEINIKIFKN